MKHDINSIRNREKVIRYEYISASNFLMGDSANVNRRTLPFGCLRFLFMVLLDLSDAYFFILGDYLQTFSLFYLSVIYRPTHDNPLAFYSKHLINRHSKGSIFNLFRNLEQFFS